jgi:hypothetical protein
VGGGGTAVIAGGAAAILPSASATRESIVGASPLHAAALATMALARRKRVVGIYLIGLISSF